MRHCGEHTRGSAGDTVSCIRPWFHRLAFAAGKCPESSLDEAIAIPRWIGASDFGNILGGRRLSVAL